MVTQAAGNSGDCSARREQALPDAAVALENISLDRGSRRVRHVSWPFGVRQIDAAEAGIRTEPGQRWVRFA